MKVRFLLFAAICALPSAAAAMADMPVTVYYEERAPYQYWAGDTLDGLTGGPAARAFNAARVKVKWEPSSIARQLSMLRRDLSPSCVVGLFKTAERQQFAKYTKPVYRDGPVVALVRPQFIFRPGNTMHDALTSPGLRVLVRSGYVYGAYVDAQIKQWNPALLYSSLPNSQMLEQLLADRADMMFMTEEEARRLLLHLGPKATALRMRRFTDAVPSEPRYIACSGKVSDDIIERLNAALESE